MAPRWYFYLVPISIIYLTQFKPIIRIHGRSMQPTLNPNDRQSQDVVLLDKLSFKLMQLHELGLSKKDLKEKLSQLRGRVVVLRSPSQPFTLLIKRVVAIPGDLIKANPHSKATHAQKPRALFHRPSQHKDGPVDEQDLLYHEKRRLYQQLNDTGLIPEYSKYQDIKPLDSYNSSAITGHVLAAREKLDLDQLEKLGFMMVPEGHCWVESDEPFRGVDSNNFGFIPLDLIEGIATTIIWPPQRIQSVEPVLVKPDRFIPRESRPRSKYVAQDELVQSLYRNWMHHVRHLT